MRTRENRLTTFHAYGPVESWPAPVTVNFSNAALNEYKVLVKAVKLYVANKPEKVIKDQTNLPLRDVRNLSLRCVRKRPDKDEIYGFYACLADVTPHFKKHSRRTAITQEQCATGKGLKGALQVLFKRKPKMEEEMYLFVTKRKLQDDVKATLADAKSIRTVFHALCRKYDVQTDEWPFNSKRQGVDAICNWARQIQAGQGTEGTDNRLGRKAGALAKLDESIVHADLDSKSQYKAFERIELDEYSAHFIDEAAVKIRSPHGTLIERLLKRFWILVAVDKRTRAILAYHISYGERYTAVDVLATLRRAVIPPERFELNENDRERQYIEGAAYPAELVEFQKNTFRELAWDGDSTHISIAQRNLVERVIGCSIKSELLGHPPVRATIEGLFSWLSGQTRILPNTTGSSPQDPARDDPEKAARILKTGPLATEEMLDLLFRNYNATPKACLGGASPLEYARQLHLTGDAFVVPLGEFTSDHLFELLPSQRVVITERRGELGGILRVCCGYASYSSPEFCKDEKLKLADDWNATIYIDRDARFAYLVADALPNRAFKIVVMDKTLRSNPHTYEARLYWNRNGRNKAAAAAAQNPNPVFGAIGTPPVSSIDEKDAVEMYLQSESFYHALAAGSTPGLTSVSEGNALLRATEALTAEFSAEEDAPPALAEQPLVRDTVPSMSIVMDPAAEDLGFMDPFA